MFFQRVGGCRDRAKYWAKCAKLSANAAQTFGISAPVFINKISSGRARLRAILQQGQILEALGAAQVTLPGGEVYQSLERGVVDAAEFSGPGIDLGMGFQEVTDFWQSPGWHQPGSLNGVMIELNKWNSLSEEQQSILETAAHANMLWTIGYYEKGATDAVKAFAEAGTQVDTLSDDDLSKLQEIANGILIDEACQNPVYAKVAASQIEYLQDYGQWRGMQGEFAMGRNLSSLPDLEAIKACATE